MSSMDEPGITGEEVITHLVSVLDTYGGGAFGDPATLKAHSYQTAIAARKLSKAAAAPGEELDHALVAAAFLHDFGHIAANVFLIRHGILRDVCSYSVTDCVPPLDDKHESVVFLLLTGYFPERICRLAGQHVLAKRVLTCDPTYLDRLTAGSAASLIVQGNVAVCDEEIDKLRLDSDGAAAEMLRYADELGKNPEMVVSGEQRELVLQSVRRCLPDTLPMDELPFTHSRMYRCAQEAGLPTTWP